MVKSHKQASEIIKSLLRVVPDYPKPGIQFQDITPVLGNIEGFRTLIHEMCLMAYTISGGEGEVDLPDAIAGIESRGFILAPTIALHIPARFVPVRKAGKLPYKTISQSYDLEYGSSIIEIHEDAFLLEEKVLVVDDLLATGGTALAACKLIEQTGAKVSGCLFAIELNDLGGRELLTEAGYRVASVLQF